MEIWVILERIGGINGSGIYFKRVRTVIPGWMHRYGYHDHKKIDSVGWVADDFRNTVFKLEYWRGGRDLKNQTSRGYVVVYSKKNMFMKISKQSLLETFLDAERKQHQQTPFPDYLRRSMDGVINVGDDFDLFYGEGFKLAKLSIKDGKVEEISWEDYRETKETESAVLEGKQSKESE